GPARRPDAQRGPDPVGAGQGRPGAVQGTAVGEVRRRAAGVIPAIFPPPGATPRVAFDGTAVLMRPPMPRPPRLLTAAALLGLLAVTALPARPEPVYVKKAGRVETIVATLEANGLPALKGPWFLIGPFDCPEEGGFDMVHPPEREIDLKKTYVGKDGEKVSWKEAKDFRPGQVYDLKRVI